MIFSLSVYNPSGQFSPAASISPHQPSPSALSPGNEQFRNSNRTILDDFRTAQAMRGGAEPPRHVQEGTPGPY